MAITLAEAVVRVVGDATGLQVALSKAEQTARQSTERIGGLIDQRMMQLGRGLQGFGASAIGLGKGLSLHVTAPIAAAAAGMFALATRTAAAGDTIAKVSREAGLSARAFQEFSFAFGQIAKVEEGQLRLALGNLNKRLGDAAKGSREAIKSFTALGFSAAEIAKGTVTSEQALDALIARLKGAASPAEAAALASELFGDRVGRVLGPAILAAGNNVDKLRGQFRDLGLGMSDEAVAASERFNDAMDVLKRQVAALGNEVGSALLPVIVETLVPLIQDTVIPALRRFAEMVAGVIRFFGALPEPVQKAAFIIAGLFAAAGPVLVAIGIFSKALGALTLATGPVGLLILAATLLVTAWTIWGDDIVRIVRTAVDAIVKWFTFLRDKVLGITKAATEGVQRAFNFLKRIVVGESIVPEMVDLIGAHFARLPGLMVGPTEAAASGVASALDRVVGHIESALTEGFSAVLRGQFESLPGIVANVLAAIEREIASFLASQVVQALRNFLEGLFGGGGGGFFQPFPILAAAGGADFIARRPTPLLVGEAGPERVRVEPLLRAAPAAADSGPGTVNIYYPVVRDESDLRRIRDAVADAIQLAKRGNHPAFRPQS